MNNPLFRRALLLQRFVAFTRSDLAKREVKRSEVLKALEQQPHIIPKAEAMAFFERLMTDNAGRHQRQYVPHAMLWEGFV